MKKILIIEDDPAIQAGLTEYLSSENFEVLQSSDGKDGYESALLNLPDLVLLDINLPSMNGIDICRNLRKKEFNNPIIMLTSLEDSVDKVVGLEVGANDYVTKPFNTRELLARIRTNLRSFEIKPEIEKTVPFEVSTEKLQRHLQAVMFTDMKNYSKKMNKDEASALKLLNIHNRMMKDSIEKFSGRIVEIIGDAFLAAFESVIEAVHCAIEVQNKFKVHNQSREKKEKLKIRIGIHLGDVIEFEGKLKGDALNIAARIQEITCSECIFLSESVYLSVKGKLQNELRFEGEYSLKNIKLPVRIYKVIY
jgi:DNA-binding response OmpR family regulator